MMAFDPTVDDLPSPSPGSPPGMTASKSSKSSSFTSVGSDNTSVFDDVDVGHFEDIGLQDDIQFDPHQIAVRQQYFKPPPNQCIPAVSSDSLRSKKPLLPSTSRAPYARDAPRNGQKLSLAQVPKHLSSFSNHLPQPQQGRQGQNGAQRARSSGPVPEPHLAPLPFRQFPTRSASTKSTSRRCPSPSHMTLSPRDANSLMKPRRRSWQSARERKTMEELEMECDEDDGDDIPEGLVLDNVPISPRPPIERSKSQTSLKGPSLKAPSLKAPSPERAPKGRIRSVGKGTPAVADAHGSLRSPGMRSESALSNSLTPASSVAPSPTVARAKSWTAALADLNADAKILTERLEEHADDLEVKAQRSSTGSIPTRKMSTGSSYGDAPRPRVKSALPELPPLRRTNIMIDPLPISKEKEAVLSRTRPSWLPPKDPAEEKRHLREYQKMVAASIDADRRRGLAKQMRSECRDTAADGLMHVWEDDILPRWNVAIRERRNRELWWMGIAPRSRGRVWQKAIGNQLGLTRMSFEAALGRAREARARVRANISNGHSGGPPSTGLQHATVDDARIASWFEAIDRDVESTWCDLRIFQAGGPLHQNLVDVLSAYAMYRSDIGYVSGSNTIAALLLLNLPSSTDAFIALASLLNRSLPLSFHARDASAKASAYNLLLHQLSIRSPNLYDHMIKLPNHNPDAYLSGVFASLFTRYLALEEATRLWDVYALEGDAVLVRAGVALLIEKEMALLGTTSVGEVCAVVAGKVRGQRVLGGDEERWMRAVRNAGKLNQ